MLRQEFALVDGLIGGDGLAVAGVEPRYARWNHEAPGDLRPTILGHDQIYKFAYHGIPKNLRYGLLLESQAIVPRIYRRAKKVIPDYELVFTHSSRLLKEFSNTRWIPGGGIWIGGDHAGGKIGLHQKTAMTSLLTSNKSMTSLHRKRYKWALRLESSQPNVQVFRQRRHDSERISAFKTLESFRYSIVVENYIDDSYFTEKILNCFATGTVPIYLGARSIGDFFDPRGIIAFSSFSELRRILNSVVSIDDYNSRAGAISANLSACLKYRCVEDFIEHEYLTARQ